MSKQHSKKYNTGETALEQFVNVVSHDLSAPLRHARFFSAELIKSLGEDIDETQRELATNVENSLGKLEAMLGSLLRYSRLVSTFSPTSTANIGNVLENVKNRFVQSDDNREISFHWAGHPAMLSADEGQISTLLIELIDNAIKFQSTERDLEVDVSVAVDGEELILTVVDNGIGMPVSDLEFALPIFRQLDPISSGEGIGLALVQRITENHGGRLELSPREKYGFSATVRLPLSHPDSKS